MLCSMMPSSSSSEVQRRVCVCNFWENCVSLISLWFNLHNRVSPSLAHLRPMPAGRKSIESRNKIPQSATHSTEPTNNYLIFPPLNSLSMGPQNYYTTSVHTTTAYEKSSINSFLDLEQLKSIFSTLFSSLSFSFHIAKKKLFVCEWVLSAGDERWVHTTTRSLALLLSVLRRPFSCWPQSEHN